MARYETLNLRLPQATKRRIRKIAKTSGRSVSDVARDLIERSLALAELRALRAHAIPQATAAGIVTDEDVFRSVS